MSTELSTENSPRVRGVRQYGPLAAYSLLGLAMLAGMFSVGPMTVFAASCGTSAAYGAHSTFVDSIQPTNYQDATKIVLSSDCTPTDADVYLQDNGSLSGNINYYIRSDNSGQPGSVIATGNAVAAYHVNGLVNETFTGASCLSAGTYYLTWGLDTGNSAGNYLISWGGSDASYHWWYTSDGASTWNAVNNGQDFDADINGTVASCSGGGGGGGGSPAQLSLYNFYSGTTTYDVSQTLTPSGTDAFTFSHAFKVVHLDTYYASTTPTYAGDSINTGYVPGTIYLDTDTTFQTYVASHGDGTFVIYETGGTAGYCFFSVLKGVVVLTDCGVPASPPVLPTTIISAVYPDPDSVDATSTVFLFGANGNILDSDYVVGATDVYIRWQQETGAGLRGNPDTLQNGSFTFPIDSSGAFNVSAVAGVYNTGEYEAYATIQVPLLNVFGIDLFTKGLGTPVTWIFTVGTSTQTEKNQAVILIKASGLTISSNGLALGSTASTTRTITGGATACDPSLSFSFSDCMGYLFTPDPQALGVIWGSLNAVLQKYPWGVATRAFDLLAGTATSSDVATLSTSLPSLAINVQNSGLAPFQGIATVDLTPWGHLMGPGSILASSTDYQGHTFRDVFELGWDFLVAFLFGMGMALQILGLNVGRGVENNIRNSRRQPRT